MFCLFEGYIMNFGNAILFKYLFGNKIKTNRLFVYKLGCKAKKNVTKKS